MELSHFLPNFLSFKKIAAQASNGEDFLNRKTRDELIIKFAKDILSHYNVRTHCKVLPKIDKPSLVLGNHIGYLDMPLVAKYCPATFVAKEEVNAWPIIGNFNNKCEPSHSNEVIKNQEAKLQNK